MFILCTRFTWQEKFSEYRDIENWGSGDMTHFYTRKPENSKRGYCYYEKVPVKLIEEESQCQIKCCDYVSNHLNYSYGESP